MNSTRIHKDILHKWSAIGVYTRQRTVIERVVYISYSCTGIVFGLILARPSLNKLICLSVVCSFVVKWRQNLGYLKHFKPECCKISFSFAVFSFFTFSVQTNIEIVRNSHLNKLNKKASILEGHDLRTNYARKQA